MESSLSLVPICTDDGEEDTDEDHGADLEEWCEALQQILSMTTDT